MWRDRERAAGMPRWVASDMQQCAMQQRLNRTCSSDKLNAVPHRELLFIHESDGRADLLADGLEALLRPHYQSSCSPSSQIPVSQKLLRGSHRDSDPARCLNECGPQVGSPPSRLRGNCRSAIRFFTKSLHHLLHGFVLLSQ